MCCAVRALEIHRVTSFQRSIRSTAGSVPRSSARAPRVRRRSSLTTALSVPAVGLLRPAQCLVGLVTCEDVHRASTSGPDGPGGAILGAVLVVRDRLSSSPSPPVPAVGRCGRIRQLSEKGAASAAALLALCSEREDEVPSVPTRSITLAWDQLPGIWEEGVASFLTSWDVGPPCSPSVMSVQLVLHRTAPKRAPDGSSHVPTATTRGNGAAHDGFPLTPAGTVMAGTAVSGARCGVLK